MATLFQFSNNARKGVLVVLGIVAVILIIDTYSKFQTTSILNPINQIRFYMKPNNALGAIPKPDMKSINLDSTVKPTYTRQSQHGYYPDVAYVYSIEKPREKLDSFENAQNSAQVLGFAPNSFTSKGDNNFEWTGSFGTRVLDYNKVSQVWSLKTSYANNLEAKKIKNISTDINTYSSQVISLVSSLGFEIQGMDSNSVDARYAKLSFDGNFVALDKAEGSAVDTYIILNIKRFVRFADLLPDTELQTLKQQKITIPAAKDVYIYTNDPRKGELRFVVSNDFRDFGKDVFEMNFTNIVYTSSKGAYQIITADEAWDRAQSGQGALVSLIPQGYNYFGDYPTSVGVSKFIADATKTELGYYEPEAWTGYVYPIFIFKGRAELSDGRQANFTYFVDAIKR